METLYGLQLKNTKTEEECSQVLTQYCAWRLDVDGLGGNIRLQDKETFIQTAANNFGLTVIQAMLDQMREGKKTYDVSFNHCIISMFYICFLKIDPN